MSWACADRWCVRHESYASRHARADCMLVRCRRRDCAGCVQEWANDQRTVIRENLRAYDGDVAVAAATAPGDDVLPRDEEGKCYSGPLERWHRTYSLRFRELDKIATKAARRVCPKWRRLVNVGELHKRGVVHRHLVLPMGTPAEREGSRAYVASWDRHRQDWGFGFIDRKLRVWPADHAARYLSKYLGKSMTERPALPGCAVTVSTLLRRRSGVTVRRLRAQRRRWARTTVCIRLSAGGRTDGRADRGRSPAPVRPTARTPPASRGQRGPPQRWAVCGVRWSHVPRTTTKQKWRRAPAPRSAASGLQRWREA